MTFSDYVMTVPPLVRMLLVVTLVVGPAMLALKAFYPRILGLSQRPEEVDGAPYVPDAYHLAGRIMSIATTAFIFLSAFTLNNFWGAAKAADEAVRSESRAYYGAVVAVDSVADPASRDAARAALAEYAKGVETIQWPMLEQADAAGAFQAHLDSLVTLGAQITAAAAADPGKSAAWDKAIDDVSDLGTYGQDRISALPGGAAPSVIWLIVILGFVNLAIITAFQPTYFKRNLFLIAVAACITGLLMFTVIEVSNPFIGGASVQSGFSEVTVQ